MKLFKGPVRWPDGSGMCSIYNRTSKRDCPNPAKHHIMLDDQTMSKVCDRHIRPIIEQLDSVTITKHPFQKQCSTTDAIWLMPANICISGDKLAATNDPTIQLEHSREDHVS